MRCRYSRAAETGATESERRRESGREKETGAAKVG